MKKITLFAAVIATVALTSCAKDRTCTCTLTDGTTSFTETIVVTKATKASVEAGECASGTQTTPASGSTPAYTSTRTCTVK